MKNRYKDVYPQYLPFHYFCFLRWRKAIRQLQTRQAEKRARKIGPQGIVDDGPGHWTEPIDGVIPNPTDNINRSALWMDEDLSLPEIQKFTTDIENIKKELTAKGLKYTATAASFIPRMYTEHTEKKNAWENAWCFRHSGIKAGDRILDIGGASTAFNFYLAKMGCSVTIIDNDWNNCGIIYNTNYVGEQMDWDIKAYDLEGGQPLPFEDNSFDGVFSICVIEHLTSQARRALMKEIGRVLKTGKIASFSTDYDHGREVLIFDKGLRFGYREKFEQDVIKSSGLYLHGNTELIDAYPEENFLGAFFLIKY